MFVGTWRAFFCSMDDWLCEALFHGEPRRILGRPLAPLCARHVAALYAMGNGYVTRMEGEGEGSPGVEALGLAVLVCSSWDEPHLQAVVRGAPEALAAAAEMGASLGDGADAASEAFADYWEDFFQCAELADYRPPGQRGHGRRWECHWLMILVAALMRGGCSLQEAWWMPFGEAMALKLALFEVEGREFRLMGDGERARYRELGWRI